MEMNHGYCGIFLMPDKKNYPAVKHSYIIELKYLSANDSEHKAGVTGLRRKQVDVLPHGQREDTYPA